MNGSPPYGYSTRTTNDEEFSGTLSIPAVPLKVMNSTKQQLEHELICKDQHCNPHWNALVVDAIFATKNSSDTPKSPK